MVIDTKLLQGAVMKLSENAKEVVLECPSRKQALKLFAAIKEMNQKEVEEALAV